MIDRDRLVELAIRLVSIPSFTGSEQACAEAVRDVLEGMGLHVQWQQVEDGRANVLGTWAGTGGGPSLMLNGHLDTSYSGREPWLQGIPGFQPQGFEQAGRIYGLGISNMKGALAAYIEAVRALQDQGRRGRRRGRIAAEDRCARRYRRTVERVNTVSRNGRSRVFFAACRSPPAMSLPAAAAPRARRATTANWRS